MTSEDSDAQKRKNQRQINRSSPDSPTTSEEVTTQHTVFHPRAGSPTIRHCVYTGTANSSTAQQLLPLDARLAPSAFPLAAFVSVPSLPGLVRLFLQFCPFLCAWHCRPVSLSVPSATLSASHNKDQHRRQPPHLSGERTSNRNHCSALTHPLLHWPLDCSAPSGAMYSAGLGLPTILRTHHSHRRVATRARSSESVRREPRRNIPRNIHNGADCRVKDSSPSAHPS